MIFQNEKKKVLKRKKFFCLFCMLLYCIFHLIIYSSHGKLYFSFHHFLFNRSNAFLLLIGQEAISYLNVSYSQLQKFKRVISKNKKSDYNISSLTVVVECIKMKFECSNVSVKDIFHFCS